MGAILRTEFKSGGANPAKTGAFRSDERGDSGRSGKRGPDPKRTESGESVERKRQAGRRRMAKVFTPNRDRLAERGYASVAHVPVLFDGQARYCRAHNRYLRERAEIEWHPGGGADYPRDRTLKNIADSLCNFIQWSEARGVQFTTATYADVLRYQREQVSGVWSTQGKLEPSTANQRADEATSFLRWAAHRGLRPAFDVKRFFAGRNPLAAHGPLMARAGRAKENRTTTTAGHFVLPTRQEVKDWLAAVREQRGNAKYLACRFILEVGPRRKEVEALDVAQWPSAADIEQARLRYQSFVPMELIETKGGRPRTVRVPLEYADSIRKWIDGPRATYVFRRFKREKRKTTRLFVTDHPTAVGNPISAQTIYRCFHEVRPRPNLWSPHKGRHAFACFYVLSALTLEAKAAGKTFVGLGADWVTNRGDHWLKMIRNQFGHMSSDTTEVYLQWLVTACGITTIASGWHDFLESED